MTRWLASTHPNPLILLLLETLIEGGVVASMSQITRMDPDSKKWVSRWRELMHPRIRPPDGGVNGLVLLSR